MLNERPLDLTSFGPITEASIGPINGSGAKENIDDSWETAVEPADSAGVRGRRACWV